MDIVLLMILVTARVAYIFACCALAGLFFLCGMLAIGLILDRLIRAKRSEFDSEFCARYRVSK